MKYSFFTTTSPFKDCVARPHELPGLVTHNVEIALARSFYAFAAEEAEKCEDDAMVALASGNTAEAEHHFTKRDIWLDIRNELADIAADIERVRSN